MSSREILPILRELSKDAYNWDDNNRPLIKIKDEWIALMNYIIVILWFQ